MMPDNTACWPSNGELDIMEMFNGDGHIFGTYIWKNAGCNQPYSAIGQSTSAGSDWADTFHEYAIEYDGRGYVSFVFDGTVFNHVLNATYYDVSYYAIIDTSVGSARAGPPNATTVFPTYHHIDYVRVAQPEAEPRGRVASGSASEHRGAAVIRTSRARPVE